MNRLVIIGDVHGCLKELKQLLDVVNYNIHKDRLIFLGDLVDRGPNSAECVKFVRKLNVECLLGNHDNKYARYYQHEKKVIKFKNYRNPMNFNHDQHKIYNDLSEDDLDWICNLPYKLFIKEHNMILMHAGVMNKFHPLYQKEKTYLYCRYLNKDTGHMMKLGEGFSKPENSVFWADIYNHDYDIVYGHQVVDLETPRIHTNACGAKTYGIDTGACYGGNLTAMIVDQDGFVNFKHVKSSVKYKDFRLNKE